MKRSELLLTAMDGVKDDYLAKALAYRKGKMLRRRGIIIAAALAAVLAVTAGAVSYSMRQAAREDLGITDPEEIPEYTEYAPEERPETAAHAPANGSIHSLPPQVYELYTPGGEVTLVSTMCSGSELTAFLSVPDVEGADETPGPWDMGLVDAYRNDSGQLLRACSFSVTEISHDTEAKATLVRLLVTGVPKDADHICAAVILRDAEGRGIHYEPLDIPVTESTGLHADINQIAAHPDLAEFTAVIGGVDVYAGYVSVEMKIPTCEEMTAMLGDEAWQKLEAATGEHIEDEEDVSIVYRDFIDSMMNPYAHLTGEPDSPGSPHYVLEGAALNLRDGTTLVLAEQDSPFAGVWVSLDAYWREPMRTGDWTFRRLLKNPVNLDEVESITIGGETFPLNPQ